MAFSAESLKQRAVELGFSMVGVIRAEPAVTLAAYFRWIEAGMQGTMGYLARPDRQIRRQDLQVILPGVRSMVLVGLDYQTAAVPDDLLQDPSRGRIASYAWGVDYHNVMIPRLETLARWVQKETGQTTAHRVYVDTGAILERAHAHQAGMGFTGKNTMLIHPRRGSNFFIGEFLIDLEFDKYDTPGKASMCGRCSRCLTACPTGAFPEPYVLDARRCISYLTIEYKDWIDRDLRLLLGNWVYGCDVCQEVCPWQRFAVKTQERGFYPDTLDHVAPKLLDLLALDEAEFKIWFRGSPIERIKRDRLVRNVCVAAGNWGDEATIPLLRQLLNDNSPLVRGHAAWALAQVMDDAAAPLLSERYDREQDDDVRSEIAWNLDSLRG